MPRNNEDYGKVWQAVVYEENGQLDHVLKMLAECGYDFAGCKHEPDDENKKPHHHITMVFSQGKTASAIRKNLDKDNLLLRKWDTKKSADRYMVHADDPTKEQINPETIYGNRADEARKHILGNEHTEGDAMHAILDFILSMPYCTYTDVVRFAIANNIYPYLRRSGYIVSTLLKENCIGKENKNGRT